MRHCLQVLAVDIKLIMNLSADAKKRNYYSNMKNKELTSDFNNSLYIIAAGIISINIFFIIGPCYLSLIINLFNTDLINWHHIAKVLLITVIWPIIILHYVLVVVRIKKIFYDSHGVYFSRNFIPWNDVIYVRLHLGIITRFSIAYYEGKKMKKIFGGDFHFNNLDISETINELSALHSFRIQRWII